MIWVSSNWNTRQMTRPMVTSQGGGRICQYRSVRGIWRCTTGRVQIDLGTDDRDRYIDPDEPLRVAMARQQEDC